MARTPGFEETFLRSDDARGAARQLRDHRVRDPVGAVLRDRRSRHAPRSAVMGMRGRGRRLLAALHRRSRLRIGGVRVSGHPALNRRRASPDRGRHRSWPRRLGRHTAPLLHVRSRRRYSHACSAFAVALFVTVWLRVRRDWSPRGLAMLGASAALMAMVREQDVFLALGPAIDWALDERHPVRDRWRAAAIGTAVSVVIVLPQLLAYQALNGHFGPSRLVARKMTWTAPHALASAVLTRTRLLLLDAARAARRRRSHHACRSQNGGDA